MQKKDELAFRIACAEELPLYCIVKMSFLFFVILCFGFAVTSCEKAPPQQPFAELFVEKKEALNEPLLELLDEIKKRSVGLVARRVKSESEPDTEVTFGFTMLSGNQPKSPPNSMLVYRSPLLLSQSPNEGQMFGGQRGLYDLADAFSKSADAFQVAYNEAGRVKHLAMLCDRVETYQKNLRYLLFVDEIKRNEPRPGGAIYVGGEYEARLVVFERGAAEPIAERKISASSSMGVTAKEFDALSDRVNQDFEENINKAIENAVLSVGKVRGEIDPIRFRK